LGYRRREGRLVVCLAYMISIPSDTVVVIGIDVGSPTRGFHAVALKAGNYLAQLCTPDTRQLVSWCRDSGARAIAIDAPCRWSATARARRAERELMAKGIWCFSTPSFEIAKNHRTNYFGWMLHGAALYADLISSGYSLFDGTRSSVRPVCFETFPHAIACALRGEVVSAKRKRHVRRTLLQEREINTEPLTNIDWIDAALCALAADHFLSGSVNTYGDVDEGFIVVPS
jgi:predicted nuclease with RNAse H fold